ncbi:para-nitrobenzyl esterase [Lipingzhangella halophila]|uniref:Carboxylic ester hydrolase n=1 Tax=Lipingzhangella halophila TaxID=1783352 RepID=A0A7W7RF21_9ACTN|nr:carboxylesterase family protein [Lipingzhangella halophila]MBB4930760.1 para-nitrobenzyl esterase [Lipingzhangella halophila]
MDRTVSTSGGAVRGVAADGGVTVYRGIPYAAPPIEDARFRAPAAPAAWDGVRDASRFGPISPQAPSLPGTPPWSPQDGADILTVNVWAPKRRPEPRPVLVWIHGGAYQFGASSDPLYEATELARAGLVVVSMNYRVGFEGFGHVPGCPDNRGLLDQVAALEWVRENIAAFGGDPENVTVAGQSAGAGSVVSLLTMPAAHGLFRRAIAYSVPHDFISPESAGEVSERISAMTGVPLTREALAAIPPEVLIEATVKLGAQFRQDPTAGFRHYATMPYVPVIDGEVLPGAPLHAIAAGATRDVDLMVCHTMHEWRLFTALGTVPVVSDEEGLEHAAAAFGLPAGSVEGYRELVPDAPVTALFQAIVSDGMFTEYTTRIAEEHARAGGRAHLSRFAWESPAMEGTLRSCHALDLPFVFGTFDSPSGKLFLDGSPSGEQRELSRRMVRAWADFAATGEPGWTAVTPDSTPVRIWDTPESVQEEDRTGVRALWRGVAF